MRPVCGGSRKHRTEADFSAVRSLFKIQYKVGTRSVRFADHEFEQSLDSQRGPSVRGTDPTSAARHNLIGLITWSN